ncbi:globin domain-containing protein [Streptacidiphilus rugosus]|uniref:globin domain-containing protein n=1 Tax=Streptacidiphilus rugosus TaxID=405783 RepID=UPI000A073AA0|nr:globin domain-containing protein [Streptacidiphilus rugosus]
MVAPEPSESAAGDSAREPADRNAEALSDPTADTPADLDPPAGAAPDRTSGSEGSPAAAAAAPAARPELAPVIANAPARNWAAGPDDAWSRAWAAPAVSTAPAPPMPIVAAPPPMPAGIPAIPLPPPPMPLPGSVVAVVPLASRQKAAMAQQAVPPSLAPQPPGAAGTPPSAAAPPPAEVQQAPALRAAPRAKADTGGVGPSPQDIVLIRRSLSVVEPVADRATAHFYAVLFLKRPELRALFPAAMDVQRDRLFRALLAAGRAADDPPVLVEYLERLARGHRKYGVLDEHYAPVGASLLAALERYCGRQWDEDTARAWTKVYAVISQVMMAAAARDAQSSPAWWQGEVQSVDPVGRDVAVVTLRTDHPYPYRAGQYASVEVPWWPRVWRHFSLASAPDRRPGADGLLRFHVKAVPAGWVSNALVHRAAPGDVLRLGPAQGSMVADLREQGPLLLVGGGTGIAPMLAVVEELALAGARRTVEVYYGARRPDELYAEAALRELDQRLPWLSVRTALSDSLLASPRGSGGPERGQLPEVIGRSGPWDGYSALLSGPNAMVRRVRGVLLDAGVPRERIASDLEDEAATAG